MIRPSCQDLSDGSHSRPGRRQSHRPIAQLGARKPQETPISHIAPDPISPQRLPRQIGTLHFLPLAASDDNKNFSASIPYPIAHLKTIRLVAVGIWPSGKAPCSGSGTSNHQISSVSRRLVEAHFDINRHSFLFSALLCLPFDITILS